jgi:nucleoid DNA-binding protein
LSIKDVKSIVKTILETMAEALVRSDNVEIREFGSFQVREYATLPGRTARGSGNKIKVAPKRPPFFKVAKIFANK